MPWLIASPTRCQPITGHAAASPASATTTERRSRRPPVYGHRRERPVWALRGNGLVSEEGGERAAGGEELGGRAAFRDDAVPEHDGAVGDEERRQSLRGDEH